MSLNLDASTLTFHLSVTSPLLTVFKYFNITTQLDSAATARLTRSATLLAKLSVLFLPVSLMTSYFSVAIPDLQGVYTAKTYWVSFAVIMGSSFVCLFFLSRFLMVVSESLDRGVKRAGKRLKSYGEKVL